LHLFCYGSLKPGERNYLVVEPWVRESRTAWVAGQLYLRETGYPTLRLREQLSLGTFDHEADLGRTARGVSAQVPADVPGCILTLAQGARLLHLLDDFEDFLPAGPGPSEYERRLVHARDEQGEVWRVWTYTATASQDCSRWSPIPEWPCPR
jgi:gamma-glutamylcyclotransferase (GGCT)/AIG2-like uncharacterized protein YtfP